MNNLAMRGSQTAKNGFQNERTVCEKFNNWDSDADARAWLGVMGYDLQDIEYVRAVVLHGYKSDVNVQIQIKSRHALDTENIQVKLVSNSHGFNQIDKRWLSNYQEMWDIPQDVYKLLQYYTGELPPYRSGTRDKRRMFLNEFSIDEQQKIIGWFTKNKTLISSDVIKGRGKFSAEWILVAQKTKSNARWVLVNINCALQHYTDGGVGITARGNLFIGHITVQRKGGDGGRPTACMLQFKSDPSELFDIE